MRPGSQWRAARRAGKAVPDGFEHAGVAACQELAVVIRILQVFLLVLVLEGVADRGGAVAKGRTASLLLWDGRMLLAF